MVDLVAVGEAASVRVRPLEDELRLISAVNQVADPEFVPFLLEAWRCYTNRGFNAALICIWCAVSCYVRSVVRDVGEEFFELWFGQEYESLERVNDETLIEVCKSRNVLGLSDPALFGWINDFRMRRNDLVHGGQWEPATTSRIVTDLAEEAVRNLLGRSVKGHTLAVDTSALYDLLEWRRAQINRGRAEMLVGAVTNREDLENLCHRLIGLYVSGEAGNSENVRLIWRVVYQQLNDTQRTNVIAHAIRETARSLGLSARLDGGCWRIEAMLANAQVSEERFRAMLEVDLWKDADLPEVHRDGYWQVFVRFLEDEVERRATPEGGSDIPQRYYRKIRELAPEKYQATVTGLVSQLL